MNVIYNLCLVISINGQIDLSSVRLSLSLTKIFFQLVSLRLSSTARYLAGFYTSSKVSILTDELAEHCKKVKVLPDFLETF